MFNMPMTPKALVVSGVLAIAGCSENPGSFTGELQPLNVAGHDVRTTFAAAWMLECAGVPEQTVMMLNQFEHVPGEPALRHIASGTVIAEGNCPALLDALGIIGGAALIASNPAQNENVAISGSAAVSELTVERIAGH